MQKIIFTSLFLVFSITISFSQETSIFYSVGGIYSDLNVSEGARYREEVIGREANTGKHSIYNSIGVKHSFFNFFNLELTVTYQERLPLEKFSFGTAQSFGGHNLVLWPSSPQSEYWREEDFIRFPNFKYLHTELIPMFQFKRKIRIAAGVGIFYGRLLNQKELIFDRSYFMTSDFIFEPPFNAQGEISYRKNDLGWIPKISFSFPIKDRLELGFSSKAYISESALMTNHWEFKSFGRKYNDTWLVFAYGLELSYKIFDKEDKRK